MWNRKWAGARSRFWRALLHLWSKVGGFRLGIAGRLAAAFVAVTVLATAANLIAEDGSQIIRTVIVGPIYRPTVSARSTQLGRARRPEASATTDAALEGVTDSVLIDSIEQFGYVVERRVASEGAGHADLVKAAGNRVRDQLEAYLNEVGASRTDVPVRSLYQRTNTLQAVGEEVVRRADERRTIAAECWGRLESIDSQVKKALDENNWRIFGRVISRQSLLRLSRDLDDIRRQSAPLAVVNAGATDLTMTSSQERFRADLEQNAAGLSRSQGTAWLSNLRKTYEDLVEAQGRLPQIDAENSRRHAAFERSLTELKTQVRELTASVRKRAHEASPPAARELPEPEARGRTAPAVTPSSSPAGSPLAASNHDGALLASISGTVLLILLVISVTTVRSIVVPIRQFMATTDRLAKGDEMARFTRGGIKELDALALSFNRMATSLAEARETNREYQIALESRVDERTRQLQHLAEHDPLTGLPNRRQFVARLDTALQRAAETSTQMAIFFIDLDNFKNINDSMGHSFGDLVLKGVAQRLGEAAGASGFAARLGGDEFTVIRENSGDGSRVMEFGNALVRAFQRPLVIEGRELTVSVSGGASIYPDHERESDALLRAADAALFRAKNSGRARIALFSPELLEAASVKFSLEQGLRRALEHGELELWFQPEVSFATLGTQLVEGLLRWRTPEGKYLAPADFLSVAEDSGLIRNIDDWVLRTAFQQAARWHHGEWPQARVAINVSARELIDTSFVTRVSELLEQYRLPARCIEIELTETVLQTEVATVEVLRELRRLDVSVALDDFGTGYSSLASLERLPLTRVKLDRSLIATIDSSARSFAIARAIIGLCENLGLEVTAEGIERPEQLALMLASPATTLQGYLFSPPIQAQDVLPLFPRLRDRMQELLIQGGVEPPASTAYSFRSRVTAP